MSDFTPITSHGLVPAIRLYGAGSWGTGYYGQDGKISVRNDTYWTEV